MYAEKRKGSIFIEYQAIDNKKVMFFVEVPLLVCSSECE